MDPTVKNQLDDLRSPDRARQHNAFVDLLAATDQPVPWAYAAWDDLVRDLSHKNNRVRAIAAQLLCNLAKGDPQKRMLTDFPALLAVTRDERFVTARHCLQALWKVGLAGPDQQKMVVAGLEGRFHECVTEKNGTLIRFDIVQVLKNLYDAAPEAAIKETALALIATETDEKYRKKYTRVWRHRAV